MKRRYFGTDGVRGPCGGPVVNEDFARRLGAATARFFSSRGAAPGAEVLLGRDTRQSGPALEAAVAAGLAAERLAPVSLGVVPTPVVARAVRRAGAAFGVVITASHNPAGDNGIKFLGPDGRKLEEAAEEAIERELPRAEAPGGAAPAVVPRPVRPDAAREYIEAVSRLLPPGHGSEDRDRGVALAGWTIVLDTANGATCVTSPAVLQALGASVVVLGNEPDGRNINASVGSEHPECLCALVRKTGARLGLALDGDGDRGLLCDERGDPLDGDEILTLLAVHALRHGQLVNRTLVVTVLSNLGVDAAVEAAGGRVVRTPVGDRHVAARMRAEGATLGGECSGHIICGEVSTTGDGLVAALKVIAVMRATGQPLSELRRALQKFPQATAALTVGEQPPLDTLPAVQAAIRETEAELGNRGRVLVRYSGTEPKIRLLVEGPDAGPVHVGLARLQRAVRAELGGA
jgi:phosphoglucosamine mutase